MGRWSGAGRLVACVGTVAAALAFGAPAATAAQTVEEVVFTASDGVSLHATVSGEAPLRPRPLIVEYSPYGQGPGGPPAGPAFNYVQVHARGTGRSGGAWDIMGAREQLDIAESLRFFCDRPWSSGRVGLYGFSASAIAAYYAMRRRTLPCVKAAALLAGTSSTYRDLIFIGGMPNLVPAAVVTTAIGSAFLANLPGRFGSDPQSVLESPGGVVNALSAFSQHPTEDAFWRERSFPGLDGPPDHPDPRGHGLLRRGVAGAVRDLQGHPAQWQPSAGHRRPRRRRRRHRRRVPPVPALVRALPPGRAERHRPGAAGAALRWSRQPRGGSWAATGPR